MQSENLLLIILHAYLLLEVCDEQILIQVMYGSSSVTKRVLGISKYGQVVALVGCLPEQVVIKATSGIECLLRHLSRLKDYLHAVLELLHLVLDRSQLPFELPDDPLIVHLPLHQLIPVLHGLVKHTRGGRVRYLQNRLRLLVTPTHSGRNVGLLQALVPNKVVICSCIDLLSEEGGVRLGFLLVGDAHVALSAASPGPILEGRLGGALDFEAIEVLVVHYQQSRLLLRRVEGPELGHVVKLAISTPGLIHDV